MLATSQLLAIGSFLTLLGYLAANDVRSLRLPLSANVAFLATGLIAGGVAFAVPVMDRLIGAGAGFVTLSLVALSYRAIRDHDGLGGGDPIMIAGLGVAGMAATTPYCFHGCIDWPVADYFGPRASHQQTPNQSLAPPVWDIPGIRGPNPPVFRNRACLTVGPIGFA